MKKQLLLLIPVFFVFFFSGCKRNKIIIDPGFSEYIAAFTSGEISVASSIRIELTGDLNQIGMPNTEIDEDLFNFSPGLKGKAYWVDKHTIEFRPDKWLISGETYTAEFYMDKIRKVEKKFRTFKFEFTAIRQSFAVTVDGYEPYQIDNLKKNLVTGKLSLADVADEKELYRLVKASQEGKKLPVIWSKNDNNVYTIQIDSVSRGEKESNVLIQWDGDPIDVDNTGEQNLVIPSIYDFLVTDVKAYQEPDQHVEIRFSDPLDRTQDLNGLISVDKEADLKFEKSKNILNVYFSNHISGSVHLKVDINVKNSMLYSLKKAFETDIVFEDIKPAVRLLGKGTILPDSKGLILPFQAVNLRAVDIRIIQVFENNVPQFFQVNDYDGQYQLKRAGRLIMIKTLELTGTDKLIDYGKWNTFSLDLTSLIKQEQGAIYRIEISFKRHYSTYPCDGNLKPDNTKIEGTGIEEFERELSYWQAGNDYYDYEYDYEDGTSEGEFNWDERDNPCTPSYYNNDRKVTCNVIASNFGMTAKSYGNNKIGVALADIVTARPLDGVEIQVLDYQQQVIGSGKTDGNGFFTCEVKGKPYLIIAKKDNQKGYLKINDGNALSFSQFDVSGQVVPKGLKAYLYGERGVWRPGDTVFLTCIIDDKLKTIPENHPVIMELYTPQGQQFRKLVKTSGLNGFYSFIFRTNEDSPTGNWIAKLKIGSVEFTKSLKIETIKPNRIKVSLDLGSPILSPGLLKANLKARWLHGASAGGLKAEISASISKQNTLFKGYNDYIFDDPTRIFDAEEKSIFSGVLDSEGNAAVAGSMELSKNAPGMLRASLLTRVYEPGGEFSIDNQVVTFSPFEKYVGLKIPKLTYGYLETDTSQIFEVATLMKEGTPVNINNLEVIIYKLDRKWWWDASEESLANYESNSYATPVYSKKISTINGKAHFSFRLNYPDWGRFLIRVVDKEGGHATGKLVFFDWPGWRGRENRGDAKNATMLNFSSDKVIYNVGDKAVITFPSALNGRILISLESGSNVIRQWWENCEGKETKVSFDVTEEMSPNIYVYASLIQPHAVSGNDLPIRLYGVIPLKVEDPESHISPVITAPSEIRPEETFEISIREKNNKPMTYTVAIVDEGLLDLTRFRTPDPWSEFYGREALGVKTWDLYDNIIGAYGGKIERLFSIGGDGEVRSQGDQKANRFKPVIKYLGPFEYKGSTAIHKIKMPSYIGSVKVMLVAGKGKAFGNAEKTIPVRKPLMILATLPRVVSPGEEMNLPVSVFAMDSRIRNVTLELESNSFFTIVGGRSKRISFSKPGESDVYFKVKVNSKLGIGKVKVIAKSGNESDTYEIELDVRNPNPKITKSFELVVDAGKNGVIDYQLPGMSGTNKATLELSSIPAIDLTRRLGYLISYPHGCAEQITSASFPQLFLDKFTDTDTLAKRRIRENVNAGILKINSMQLINGGVMYWPGFQEPNQWVSSYAGHFMLIAKEKGYEIPSGFLKNWVKYQKNEARNWVMPSQNEYYFQSDLVQAYRLYTLALAGEPDLGAMNRMREVKGLSVQAVWRLAATYALAGQNEVARQLLVSGGNEIRPYGVYSYTFGSEERDWAMLLETYTLLKDRNSAFSILKKIASMLSGNSWLSTQTTAFCLYSIGKALEEMNIGGNIQCIVNGPGITNYGIHSTSPIKLITLKSDVENGSVSIKNSGKGSLFARVITEGIPENGPSEGFENNLLMNVHFSDLKGNNLEVDNLEQGKDFLMTVTVKNPGQSGNLKDLALTQIIPSGCEIINSRFLEMDAPGAENVYTYMDVRDDRVLTYFDIQKGETKTFTVRLNASYSGKFYLPGIYCEAMYDSKVNALIPGRWIEIN